MGMGITRAAKFKVTINLQRRNEGVYNFLLMKVIGLTGGGGWRKSLAAARLAEKGLPDHRYG